MVQSATVVVPLTAASPSEQLLGQWYLMTGDILVFLHVEFLTGALSQSFTLQVVADALLGHHNSSRNQYDSSWKAFQLLWLLPHHIHVTGHSVSISLFSLP